MARNAPVELIAKQTDAVATKAAYKINQDRIPTTIVADVLAGAEEVNFYFSIDAGVTWATLQVDGSPVVLTATDNAKTFYGPMLIAVDKDATAGACGVFAVTADK